MLVEAFVAEPAVERFDVGVLGRLARLDQPQGHAAGEGLGQHRAAAELRAVVGAENARQTPVGGEPVERARDGQPAERPRRDDGYGLGGRVVDNRQALHDPPLGGAVEHEVGGPHVVRHVWTNQGLPLRARDLLAPTPADLEVGFRVQALDAFMIDQLAGLPQLQ